MDLSESERIILSNQYKILEQLYPDEAETHKKNREIIDNGYTLNYKEVSPLIDGELSNRECNEVLEILAMHSVLHFSYQGLDDKEGITIRFSGFDGNKETKQMAYARFYINELQEYTELIEIVQSPDFNSHCPTLQLYRLMLDEWEKCTDKNNLTRDEINRIINVRMQ